MVEKLRHIGLGIVLALAIICVAVIATLAFKPLFYFDVDFLNLEEQSGYAAEEIIENYDALIDYNLAFGDDYFEPPTFPQTDSARSHFHEVKLIFNNFKYAAIILSLLSVFLVVLFRKKKWGRLYLKYSSIFAIAIPVIIGIFAAVNWHWIFIKFHEIVFDNQDWYFNPATDPIINVLPNDFFMHCALLIAAIVLIGGLVCMALYKRSVTNKQQA